MLTLYDLCETIMLLLDDGCISEYFTQLPDCPYYGRKDFECDGEDCIEYLMKNTRI